MTLINERSGYTSPGVIYCVMTPNTASKTYAIGGWKVGYGPGGTAMGYCWLASSAPENITVRAYMSDVIYVDDMGKMYDYTDPETPVEFVEINSWGVYNYVEGRNPELAVTTFVRISVVTPGQPVGDGTLWVWGPSYSATIYVRGGTDDVLVYDTFTDADGTLLPNHAPDSQPAGAVQGWVGSAGDNKGTIDDNLFVVGGNSGNWYQGRLYSSLYTSGVVYADIRREGSGILGSAGVIFRCSEMTGTSDNSVDHIKAWIAYSSASTVNVSWQQNQKLGAVQTTLAQGLSFTSLAWNQWAERRLLLRANDDVLRVYVGDAGGGNYSLLTTTSLTTSWADSSHQYVGLAYTHYNQGLGFDLLGASQVSLGVSPSGNSVLQINGNSDSTGTFDGWGSVYHIPIGFPVSDLTYEVTYGAESEGWLEVSLDTTTSPVDVQFICSRPSAITGFQRAVVAFDSPDTDNGPQNVTVAFCVNTQLENGTYDAAGSAATLAAVRLLTTDTGRYLLVGSGVTLGLDRVVQASTGAYEATLADATLAWGRIWEVATGAYLHKGNKVVFYVNGWAKPDPMGDSDWTDMPSPADPGWARDWRPRAKIPNP